MHKWGTRVHKGIWGEESWANPSYETWEMKWWDENTATIHFKYNLYKVGENNFCVFCHKN